MRNTIIKKLSIHLAVLVGFAAAAHSVGAAIVVDGNLSDWNVVVKTAESGTSPGTVYNGFGGIAGFKGAQVEDTNDLSNNYYVGPNYGGQNYDAEMLAVAVQDNNLLIAILSGQRPDNGLSRYSPGDIRITTDGGRVFGIEVGGGLNGGSSSDDGLIVHEGDNGTFYTLLSNGYTDAVTTDTNKLAGELWETTNADSDPLNDVVAGWVEDPIGAPSLPQLQLNVTGGTLLGMADYVFTRNSAVDDNGITIDANTNVNDKKEHSVIELSLALSAFQLGNNEKITQIEWRPSCGNDELIVIPTGGFGPNDIPEPASILVWGLLSVACAGFGFRRRSRRCVE